METLIVQPKLGAQFLSGYAELSEKLGGRKLLGTEIQNDYDLFDVLETGLTKTVFLHVKKFTGLNLSTLGRICNVTPRSIQLKDEDYHFDAQISEILIDITDLFIIGVRVFSTNTAFIEWMVQPLPTMDNKEPISLLVNMVGRKMVKEELIMFATGVYR